MQQRSKVNAHVVVRGLYFCIWLHGCREPLKANRVSPRLFMGVCIMKSPNFFSAIVRHCRQQHPLVGTWQETGMTTKQTEQDIVSMICPDDCDFGVRYTFLADGTCLWEYTAMGETHHLTTHWTQRRNRLQILKDKTYRIEWSNTDEIVLVFKQDGEEYCIRLHRCRSKHRQ